MNEHWYISGHPPPLFHSGQTGFTVRTMKIWLCMIYLLLERHPCRQRRHDRCSCLCGSCSWSGPCWSQPHQLETLPLQAHVEPYGTWQGSQQRSPPVIFIDAFKIQDIGTYSTIFTVTQLEDAGPKYSNKNRWPHHWTMPLLPPTERDWPQWCGAGPQGWRLASPTAAAHEVGVNPS